MWRWDQAEPFGNNPADEDPDANSVAFDLPLRLPGQRYDKETGLAYNMARDYASDTGRYMQSDPIGLAGGINTYAYATSDPLRRIDAEGLKPFVFRISVGGGVSVPGIAGQVVNLNVTDPIAGQSCNYTVSCIGAGWSFRGIPMFSGGSPPITWDDGKECSNCRQFEGNGMAGVIAVQVGPIGYTPADWLEVPNGPRLDFSGWSPAQVSVGGGTFACRFALR